MPRPAVKIYSDAGKVRSVDRFDLAAHLARLRKRPPAVEAPCWALATRCGGCPHRDGEVCWAWERGHAGPESPGEPPAAEPAPLDA